MERKLRYVWWFVLIGLVIMAIWKLFLSHSPNAYVQKTAANREIVVYVDGAVEKSGLVHLAPDARLDDALQQVGLLPEADLEKMNPAERLKDGQKITVPEKSVLPSPEAVVPGNPMSVRSPSPVAETNSGSGEGRVNINTAGAVELDKLPGIGPALAERIIQYRTEHGPFGSPEDLKNVSGIGPKTYEKMAAQVTVSP